MTSNVKKIIGAVIASIAMTSTAAHAELVLSQVVVDLRADTPAHQDIEVWNNGSDRMYAEAVPAQIVSPGQPNQKRVENPDPSVLGLLVTPQRMVLEPGERKIVRVSALIPRDATERIYRVVIKPVAGPIVADATALKLFVGYDVLVLYRPQKVAGEVTGTRNSRQLVITNNSNSAKEMFDGEQCDAQGQNCQKLESIRLYAGAKWTQTVPYDTQVHYRETDGDGTRMRDF
jgi:Mat/Ecp fimbriae periplasmic chaperone